MNSRQKRALDHYNLLFQHKEFRFQDFDVDTLPESTKKYLNTWVIFFKRTVELHMPVFENTYVFHIAHPVVKYLICDAISETHMWGDKNFENIDNNMALSLMSASMSSGISPEDLKDIFDHMDAAGPPFNEN